MNTLKFPLLLHRVNLFVLVVSIITIRHRPLSLHSSKSFTRTHIGYRSNTAFIVELVYYTFICIIVGVDIFIIFPDKEMIERIGGYAW